MKMYLALVWHKLIYFCSLLLFKGFGESNVFAAIKEISKLVLVYLIS